MYSEGNSEVSIRIHTAHIYSFPPHHISSFLQPVLVELDCSRNLNLTAI